MGERSGTAVPLQARAMPTYWNVGLVLACEGTGRAKLLAVQAQIFFSPSSRIVLGQLPTK